MRSILLIGGLRNVDYLFNLVLGICYVTLDDIQTVLHFHAAEVPRVRYICKGSAEGDVLCIPPDSM
jgi:hypothetical protein